MEKVFLRTVSTGLQRLYKSSVCIYRHRNKKQETGQGMCSASLCVTDKNKTQIKMCFGFRPVRVLREGSQSANTSIQSARVACGPVLSCVSWSVRSWPPNQQNKSLCGFLFVLRKISLVELNP